LRMGRQAPFGVGKPFLNHPPNATVGAIAEGFF